jgi:hypothetical protein
MLLHAASRVVFYRVGIRFDVAPLFEFWQFVDPALLRDDLARSLFYLHSQPPLFNAFLGVVLKLAPRGAEQAAFWGCYLALGAILHVSLYSLVRAFGAGRFSAAAAALLFSISPAVICYESWLFYSYPLAALLAAAAALMHRFAARGGLAAGLLAFGAIAAIALTYSLFHLAWCLAALALVLVAVPSRRRLRTLVAGVPLLLVVALYAKNAIVFGQFAATSWFGMNLAKITVYNAPPAERAALVRAGTLTPLALVPPFSALEEYPRELQQAPRLAAPILEIRTKTTGVANLHHLAYLEISRRYLADALALIRARPDVYLWNVANAFGVYALPATANPFLGWNPERIRSWERAWRIVPGGAPAALQRPTERADRSDLRSLAEHATWGWMACLAVALVGSTLGGVRALREPGSQPRAALLLFVALCLGTVTLVGNLIELGENNRFRFAIDPLIWATLWGWVDAGVRRFRGGMLRSA